MKYRSTRGGDELLSFEEAVLTGLAPNGGLYIPTFIPSLPSNWETEWRDFNFPQLSHAVLSLYISPNEIASQDLRDIIERSYSTFRTEQVTPATKLNDDFWVLELWHGPTFAFKDVALQFLGNLFEFFLKRKNARGEAAKLTVVGATSGDTGSAAIYGLRGKENVSIFILHPKGRVSPIQEAQMTTVLDANVHNVAVVGTFDDCQDIVKALFSDKAFNDTHKLGAINSINWARILAQIVYYFYAYFRITSTADPAAQLQFVVPTGNFGDVLAGYYAKRMGLPMGQLGIGTNENDILARFWKTGRYEKEASTGGEGATAPAEGASDGQQAQAVVKETLSPAMDILVSSNFERLLWYLAFEEAGGDVTKAGATVDGWMRAVKADGKVTLPVKVLELARRDFVAERISDEQTLETIKQTFLAHSYVVDPHTAVGLGAAQQILPPSSTVTQVVLSTAHPAKFSDAVTRALDGASGYDFAGKILPEEFKGLLERPRRVIDVPRADIALVKAVIEREASGRAEGSMELESSV